jgi:trehalose 6-phosphate synthase
VTELVIASNRGPAPARGGRGPSARSDGGAGGLLTGLTRALRGGTGTWVSLSEGMGPADAGRPTTAARRPGHDDEELPGSSVRLDRVDVVPHEFDAYYNGVSNGVLWPLQLGLFDPIRGPSFDATFQRAWASYRTVNRRVAMACIDRVEAGGQVLVHDYHLALVPAMVRAVRADVGIAHFTHCPWADPAHFAMLPDAIAGELLDGMLGSDLLGFYAPRWAWDFVRTCGDAGYGVSREEGVVRASDGRLIRVRAYPLGVEPRALRDEAACGEVQRHRRALQELADGRRLVVRVERMDPAKNLLRGLDAFESFLRENRWARERVVHFVLACATRRGVPEYRRYSREVAARVRAIDERFGTPTWRPVVLEERQDYFLGLAAMSLADVVVVNSLRDGMNIVAKEAPTVNERDAVLILSRNAGAVDDLGHAALLVNPFDTQELTGAMVAALAMPAEERRARANLLRKAASAFPPREWLAAQRRDLAEARAGAEWLPSGRSDE